MQRRLNADAERAMRRPFRTSNGVQNEAALAPAVGVRAGRVWVGLGLAGLLCGLAAGCSRTSAAAQAKKEAPLPKVVVALPVRKQIVEWDEYVGRLAPLEAVDVRSRLSGYLVSTHFDEGQMVKAGDLLAVIDQRPYLAEVERTQANLAAAKAQLGQARSNASQTSAEKRRAEIRRDLAQKHYARAVQLRQKNATTLEDMDVRESELAQAHSDVAVAEAGIDSAESAVIAAKANVEVAQANLDIATLNLEYTKVLAPISGRISRRYVTEGNLVSGGTSDSTLLTTIVSVDPVHCYFDVDEQSVLKYLKLAREGKRKSSREVRNPVYLALANEKDGFPHVGHVDFVENRLDDETATIRARAILPNKHLDLTPGLFARVRLPGSARYEALLIPDRAIGTDQSDKFVLVVDQEKRVQRKPVTLGSMSHGLRVIHSGLTGDEQIVISGQQKARPGAQVDATVEVVTAGDESLPDDYEPVPEEKWLTPKRTKAANAMPLDEQVDGAVAGEKDAKRPAEQPAPEKPGVPEPRDLAPQSAAQDDAPQSAAQGDAPKSAAQDATPKSAVPDDAPRSAATQAPAGEVRP